MHTNGEPYDFNKFTSREQFCYDIGSGKITIKQAKNEQDEMSKKISDLKKYNPTNKTKATERSKVLENARNFFDGRKKIIDPFEDGILQMPEKVLYKNQAEKQAEEQAEKHLVTRLLKKKQKA